MPALALFLVLTIVGAITTDEEIRIEIQIDTWTRDTLGAIVKKRRVATINRIDRRQPNVFFPIGDI